MKRPRSSVASSTCETVDLSGLHQILCCTVFPRLQLGDLQALRCTSTALRHAVDKLSNSVWTTIARQVHSFSFTCQQVPGFCVSRVACAGSLCWRVTHSAHAPQRLLSTSRPPVLPSSTSAYVLAEGPQPLLWWCVRAGGTTALRLQSTTKVRAVARSHLLSAREKSRQQNLWRSRNFAHIGARL